MITDTDELLNNYLDGEMSPAAEQNFFETLSSDSSLRHSFRESLSLRSSFRSSSSSLVPPAELTSSIFKAVGVSIPITSSSSSNFLRWKTAGAMVFGGSVMFLLMLWSDKSNEVLSHRKQLESKIQSVEGLLTESSRKTDNLQSSLTDSKEAIVTLFNNQQKELNSRDRRITALVSENLEMSKRQSFLQQIFVDRGVSSSTTTSGFVGDLSNSNQTQRHEPIAPSKSGFFSKSVVTKPDFVNQDHVSNGISVSAIERIGLPVVLSSMDEAVADDMKHSISFRSVQGRSTIESGVATNDKIGFSNFGLRYAYQLVPEAQITAEFGREPFVQQYRIVSGMNRYEITQQPTLAWATVGTRLTSPTLSIANSLRPYGQIMGGFAQVGPIVRLQGGVTSEFGGRYHAALGYEWSRLFYSVSNSTQNSTRNSWTLEFGVSF